MVSPLRFNPEDPFPLAEAPGGWSYADAQAHSEEVDAWLELRTREVEATISDRMAARPSSSASPEQLWIGLPVKTLLTPYTELRALLDRLEPRSGQRIIDLGAGYGRMGFVLGRHFPGAEFLGYEKVAERVIEGARALKRWSYPGIQLLEADLTAPEFVLPEADFYFLYDYGSRAAIQKTLEDLRTVARRRPVTVIGRGRASRDAIERDHPWLSQIVRPEHEAHWSLYKSG